MLIAEQEETKDSLRRGRRRGADEAVNIPVELMARLGRSSKPKKVSFG